ncbi:putative sugar O-methyltransferase [Nocardia tengchongensis]
MTAEDPILTVVIAGGHGVHVRALLRHLHADHAEAADRVRVSVIDGGELTDLDRSELAAEQHAVIDARERTGTTMVDWAFRTATTPWVLCLEPEVRLEPGALSALCAFLAAEPDCPDLLQGPMIGPDGTSTVQLAPIWRDGRFGIAEPGTIEPGSITEVGMHDLGVFACRTDTWPGVNTRLHGAARLEGYLHKKVRAAGHRTLCLPFLGWTTPRDRAEKPTAAVLRDRLVQWTETGMEIEPVIEHFAELLGARATDTARNAFDTEQHNPFWFFDEIVCLNLDSAPHRWQAVLDRFAKLGIADRVRRIPAVETPELHHVGCALSHRRAFEFAAERGVSTVLIFEDDAVFLDGARWVLRNALREVRDQPWHALYLGGHHFYIGKTDGGSPVPGCTHLERVTGMICAHAVAFQRPVYEHLLTELPAGEQDMAEWIAANGYIDLFYAERLAHAYRTVPVIASQENYIAVEKAALRDSFDFTPDGSPTRQPSDFQAHSPATTTHARPGPDDPRLHELRTRYRAVTGDVRPGAFQAWGRDARRNLPLHRFRAPGGPYAGWNTPAAQDRPVGGREADVAFAAYIHRTGDQQLLAALHDQDDDAFGNLRFPFRSGTVSRDLLDSVNELGFLHRTGALGDQPRVLDIGAGYGRLAHHAARAIPALAAYTCVDAVPESTYLSEVYLGHHGVLGNPVDVVALDELHRLRGTRFDLAVAARSFTEMSRAAATFWIDLITELDIPAVFVATNERDLLYTIDGGYERHSDLSGYLAASGYHLARNEPQILDPATRNATHRTGHHLLFRR